MNIKKIIAGATLALGMTMNLPVLPAGADTWDVLSAALLSPGIDPPGVNRPCRPSTEHPYPVVLLHGITGDRTISWITIAPSLVRANYCVFALDYGQRGTEPMEQSAPEIARFVDVVLATTGAPKVAIVGYSEGGLIARYYLKFLGGASKVDELVGIAPPNHGTSHPLFPALATLTGCQVCVEAAPGSSFLEQLNQPDEAVAGVDYTVIATTHDDLVLPFRTAFLHGPKSQVTNVVLQDSCPGDLSDHFLVVADPVTAGWVKNALGHDGPASADFSPGCAPWL